MRPGLPPWAPERFRLRGVDYTFDGFCSRNTGDAMYSGTRKGVKVHALCVNPATRTAR